MTLSSHKTDPFVHHTFITVMTQHDFLREIYNDFCIKNDMPKHKGGGYLSAGDIKFASAKYSLTKHQKDWLQAYLILWANVEEKSYMESLV